MCKGKSVRTNNYVSVTLWSKHLIREKESIKRLRAIHPSNFATPPLTNHLETTPCWAASILVHILFLLSGNIRIPFHTFHATLSNQQPSTVYSEGFENEPNRLFQMLFLWFRLRGCSGSRTVRTALRHTCTRFCNEANQGLTTGSRTNAFRLTAFPRAYQLARVRRA